MLAAETQSAPARPLSRAAIAAWAAAVLALYVVRLGAAPLFDVDEGAFGEATREMVASGDYGFPTLDGAPRFDKPILIYWLQAASVRALGVSELALRLPSALCAWAWCLAVAWFAGQRRGARAGLLAGTVLATSAGPLVIGRASTADALLNLLLALTLLDAWRYLEGGRLAPLRRAYLWMGLGLLAKGPVALVIPAATSFLYLASRRELRRWLRLAFDLPGWAILLAVAAPWYAWALHVHGMAFVNGFLVQHNLARYTTVLERHGGSIGYYVLMLPVLLLPWAALLPSVVRNAPALWRAPLERYLLVWAGFVLVFFSLSGTKLPHYALYGATPLFLLLARAAEEASPRARRATAALVAVVLVMLAVLPSLVPAIAPRIPDPVVGPLLAGAGRGAWVVQLGAALALIGWACLRFLPLGAGPRPEPAGAPGPGLLVAGAAAMAVVVAWLGTPWLGEVLQGPVRRAALVARERSERAVQWKVRLPSFSLYRGAETPRADPGQGELAITREAMVSTLPSAEVLYREGGYVLLRASPTPRGGAPDEGLASGAEAQ